MFQATETNKQTNRQTDGHRHHVKPPGINNKRTARRSSKNDVNFTTAVEQLHQNVINKLKHAAS